MADRTCRALVWDTRDPKIAEVRTLAIPPTPDDGILIRVGLAGICGSELSTYRGQRPGRGLLVPGHEVIGWVEEVGASFRGAHGGSLAVGELVVPEPYMPCGECRFCRGVGSRPGKLIDYGMCPNRTLLGDTLVQDQGTIMGGWSELIQLPGKALVHRLRPDVALTAGVLTEPLAVAVHAVRIAEIITGDVVVIQGPGPIGLLCAVAAREAGAGLIVLTGTAEDAARLALGRELSADVSLDVTAGDPLRALLDLTGGRKADRVLDTTGAPPAFEQGLSLTAPGGVLTVVGGYGTGRRVSFVGDELLRSKIDIRFAHGVANAFQAAVAIIAGGRYPLARLVTHVFPLERALEGLEALDRQKASGAVKVALDPMGGGSWAVAPKEIR